MANTRIILNRQSDLKLTGAEILSPIGIVEGDIAGLLDHFSSVEKAAKAEEAARIAGDADLNAAIEKLSSDLNMVSNQSEAADASLEAKVSTEKGRIDAILSASTADADSFAEILSLINSVDTDNDQAFAGYVLSNDAALSTEVAAREAGDEHLAQYIDAALSTEVASRESVDTSLELRLSIEESTHAVEYSTEVAAREAGDEHLAQYIDAALSTEVAAREAAVSAEESARIAGDLDLQSSVETLEKSLRTETKSREAGDASLEAKVSTEKGRIDAILSAATADADSFAEIVTLINSVDTENDTAFASYVLSNNEAVENLGYDLDGEQAARVAADASLEVVLSAEISVQNSIDQAIKDGVNAALVEVKDMIMNAIEGGAFRIQNTFIGDGTTVEFGAMINGKGAIYLNGLLQEEGVDYTFVSSGDGKGNLIGIFTFNDAPESGASVVIYGQSGYVVNGDWYGNLTPLA